MTPTSSLTYEQFLEAVRILAQPSWTDIAGVLVAGVVGVGQCLLIAWGIKVMRDGNASRDANLKALETQGKALDLGNPRKSLGDPGESPGRHRGRDSGTLATVRLLACSLYGRRVALLFTALCPDSRARGRPSSPTLVRLLPARYSLGRTADSSKETER